MGAKTSLDIVLDESCESFAPALEVLGHHCTLQKTLYDLYLGPQFARLTPAMVEAAKLDKDGLGPLAKLVVAGACRVKRELARSEKVEKSRKPRKKGVSHES